MKHKLIMENWREFLKQQEQLSEQQLQDILPQLAKELKKAFKFAEDEKVKAGAQIVFRAMKDQKVDVAKVARHFFDIDPLGGVSVDVGRLEAIATTTPASAEEFKDVFGVKFSGVFESHRLK